MEMENEKVNFFYFSELVQQEMNYFNIEEANWGLRFVEKAPMDRLKVVNLTSRKAAKLTAVNR